MDSKPPTVVLRPATRPDPERRRQLVAWLAELLDRAERRRADNERNRK